MTMKLLNWLKNRIPSLTKENCLAREEQLRKELSNSESTSELKSSQLEFCTSLEMEISEDPSENTWEVYLKWLFVMMPNKFAAGCFLVAPIAVLFVLAFLALFLCIKLFALILPWFAMAVYFFLLGSLGTFLVSGFLTILFVYFLNNSKKEQS